MQVGIQIVFVCVDFFWSFLFFFEICLFWGFFGCFVIFCYNGYILFLVFKGILIQQQMQQGRLKEVGEMLLLFVIIMFVCLVQFLVGRELVFGGCGLKLLFYQWVSKMVSRIFVVFRIRGQERFAFDFQVRGRRCFFSLRIRELDFIVFKGWIWFYFSFGVYIYWGVSEEVCFLFVVGVQIMGFARIVER